MQVSSVQEMEQQRQAVMQAEVKAQLNVDKYWNRFTHLRVRAASGTATSTEREELDAVRLNHADAVTEHRECSRLLKVVTDDLQVACQHAEASAVSAKAAHAERMRTKARTALASEETALLDSVVRLAVLTAVADGRPLRHITADSVVNIIQQGFEAKAGRVYAQIADVAVEGA